MSIKVMTKVFEGSQAALGTRLVLLAIADNADEETQLAWPSVASISRKANLSESAVHRAIRKLVTLGELTVTERPQAGDRHASNLYRVTLGCQNDTLGVSLAEPTRVAPEAPVGAASGTQWGSPAAPEPSVEPSLNRQKSVRQRGWRRVPAHEQLTEDRKKMAWETKNLPAKAAAEEWAAFKDHDFPTSRVDVDATWRNWCRKAKYVLPAPPPAPGKVRSASPSEPTRIGEVVKDWHRAIPDAEETRRRLKEREEVGL